MVRAFASIVLKPLAAKATSVTSHITLRDCHVPAPCLHAIIDHFSSLANLDLSWTEYDGEDGEDDEDDEDDGADGDDASASPSPAASSDGDAADAQPASADQGGVPAWVWVAGVLVLVAAGATTIFVTRRGSRA